MPEVGKADEERSFAGETDSEFSMQTAAAPPKKQPQESEGSFLSVTHKGSIISAADFRLGGELSPGKLKADEEEEIKEGDRLELGVVSGESLDDEIVKILLKGAEDDEESKEFLS